MNSLSTTNNHLLERIGVTVIYLIFYRKLSLYYPDLLFDVQTAYSRTRERKSVRAYEERHKETPLTKLTSDTN